MRRQVRHKPWLIDALAAAHNPWHAAAAAPCVHATYSCDTNVLPHRQQQQQRQVERPDPVSLQAALASWLTLPGGGAPIHKRRHRAHPWPAA